MSLSKRRRWEIFQRDDFTCRYCGRSSPEVVLEVDHIHARSNGGSDDDENLVTSCTCCNRGKYNLVLLPPARTVAEQWVWLWAMQFPEARIDVALTARHVRTLVRCPHLIYGTMQWASQHGPLPTLGFLIEACHRELADQEASGA